jgi:hypothetical protein
MALARHEARRAAAADETALRAQVYHDVALRAVRRA